MEGQGNALDVHALRGTFATHAADNGASIAALGEITGHKDISVLLNRYTKAMRQTKRAAIAALPWVTPTQDSGSVVPIDGHSLATASNSVPQIQSQSSVG
jgi:hypothetical protein